MALGKRLINTGAAAAACSTDSVQVFGVDAAYSSNIALYQLDGDGGVTNNVPDTTTNYDGTASNVTYATGYIGNAAVFNGSSSKISTSLPVNDVEALSIWIYFESGTTVGRALGTTVSSSGGNLFLEVATNGGFSVSLQNLSEGAGAGALGSTGWKHIYYDTDRNLYVNGVSISSTSSTQSFPASNVLIGALRTNFGFFNSKIDQVRFFNRVLNADEISTLYNETTSTASNTNPLSDGSGVALYSLDYDASDAGGLYDGSPTNVDFGVDGQINYGARFNGSSSYIQADGIFSSSPSVMSASVWFKTTVDGSILEIGDSSVSTAQNRIFFSSGLLYVSLNGGGGGFASTSATGLQDGNWHHIVAVWDDGTVTNGIKMYIDGATTPTAQGNSTQSFISALNLFIGANDNRGSSASPSIRQYFNGSIDQVRIFSKALSSDEVSTLYAETACVYTSTTDIVNYPTGTTPVAYYKLDNSSEDYSTGGNDGTDTNVEYRFGRFGQAADFNGSSSKITLPTGSPFNDSNTIKAVSAWVKADTSMSRVWPLSISSTSNANYFWYIGYMGDLNRIYIAVRNGSSSNESIAYAITTTDTNWHHIFVQITATGKEIYLDGVKQTVIYTNTGSATNTSWISYPSYSGTVQGAIGVLRLSSPQYSNGFVDQVRIYDAALTDIQVTELYNEKPEVDTSNFKTVLYEGNGATQYISNLGFQPDLVWIKERTSTSGHQLRDSVRGVSNSIISSSTAAEVSNTNLTSFDVNGFTAGVTNGLNENGQDYVAWCWKAGGDAVAGSSSQATNVSYSANTEAGFSIVKFTASNSTSTPPPMNYISHGLNSPVEMTIYKRLDVSQNWVVQHKDLDQAQAVYLDLTNAAGTPNPTYSFFDNTSQSGNIGVRSNFTISRGAPYIAYCFHSVAGYSKIGSYEGNGTSATTTITTGFEPSWVMIKRTDSANNWVIFDDKRDTTSPLSKILYADTNGSDAEGGATTSITISSTGFSMTTSQFGGSINTDGGQYIYMAFK